MTRQLLIGGVFAVGALIAASSPSVSATLSDAAWLAGDMSTQADTEPSIAVSPVNPQQIVIVAFSGNWGASTSAPIYKSDDGGSTWRRVAQIGAPAAGQSGPGDQKLAFDRNGNLYAVELAIDSMSNPIDYVYRQAGTPDAPMAVGASFGWDQPHLDIDKAAGSILCIGRLYSPWLDFNVTNAQSNVEYSPNFGATVFDAAPGYNLYPNRTTRIALGPDGKAYIVYKTREGTASSGFEYAHFVVRRSDDCGVSWTALGAPVSVTGATQVQTYFTTNFGAGAMTNRARSSDGWIAVDPNTGDVYVSYIHKDASGFGQIYVARSADDGGTWTTHRVTDGTHNSAFPEIAVTHHGTVGVLYIDYDTTSGTAYRHRFARSGDLGVTWSDQILQSMDPTTLPNASPGFIWGDYEGVTAVGTAFFGVFTGASIGRPTPQLDPIFFREDEFATAEDFYVRDWTTSSAVHDNGAEPSTEPTFYSTSDIWNRRSNTPGVTAGGVPPDHENPQPVADGHNYVFARISRNASGVARSVDAHFLYADYGLGSGFTAAAASTDPSVAFAAGDTQLVTAGYEWDLPITHSPHVCMAVEISVAGTDPFMLPDLSTTAPGPADPLIVDDNNKAQRNMGIYPALGESTYYAIIHNPDLQAETMNLRFTFPGRQAIPPRITVRVISDQPNGRREPVAVKPGALLSLANMLPGENRWLEFDVAPAPGAAQTTILIEQVAAGHVVNGFGLMLKRASLEEMIKSNAIFERQILRRLEALRLAGTMGVARVPSGIKEYQVYVGKMLEAVEPALRRLFARERDAIGLNATLESIKTAQQGTNLERLASLHAAYLNRLDALLTMIQKRRGDPADVGQTVRFERKLFATMLAKRPRAREIVAQATKFLASMRRRLPTVAEYVGFLRATLPDLPLGAGDDLASLQHAHMSYLVGAAAKP